MTDDRMLNMTVTLKLINENLSSLVTQSHGLAERIQDLEKQNNSSKTKSMLYRVLLFIYPLAIVLLLFVSQYEHRKMNEVLDDAKELIVDVVDLVKQ